MDMALPNFSDIELADQKLSPAEMQTREWLRTPPVDALKLVRETLGDGYIGNIPCLYGHHAVIKVISRGDCDVSTYENLIRDRLDEIGWEWITLKTDKVGKIIQFGTAPIRRRDATIAYHSTLKVKIESILDKGLLPSDESNRQTDFPDTEGRIHVTQMLEGDGSAVRWIKIFGERYKRPQTDYAILRVNLEGLAARIYEDAHSQYGIVIDRTENIPPENRIQVVDSAEYTLEL
jgi:hypothetical protein